jgi:hypothetical protein
LEVRFNVAVPVFAPAVPVFSDALIPVELDPAVSSEKLPLIGIVPEAPLIDPSNFSENPSFVTLFCTEKVCAATASPTCRFPNAIGFPVTVAAA